MRLARVFPRVTRATPVDGLTFHGPPPMFVEADEVHVSVTFTADKLKAEWLAEQWQHIAPVKVGGVAYGDRGEDFIPGKYIRHGYTFTSRGCPERCWFCSVWKRDPQIRLLPIGYPMDTFEKAEVRLREMCGIGFTPYAMLWQPEAASAEKWKPAPIWKQFQRRWARPAIIHSPGEIAPNALAQKLFIFQ